MSKTLMLSGPHAIGKTTTAQKLSKEFPEYLYVASFAGKIARDMGYDLNDNPTPEQTLGYQEEVLKAFQMSYDITLEEPTVYDRSPLDFAAYAILQLQHLPELKDRLREYVQQCILTTQGYCDVLIIPEADLTAPYEDKGNRPTFSDEQIKYRLAYASILGVLAKECTCYIEIMHIPKEAQYDDRIKFIVDKLGL